ncbi:MAG: NAD-dependent epimerase/dehydratase family protein [Candidatus Lokiarchaeota archaeon]|nr:NAD-dependent epimerase/dehydratase family protein [Candidatus Lokiarchaeota archaeon]
MNEYNWEEKKILITGATGLVGSWLIKELIKKGSSIIALIRDNDFQSEFFRSKDYLQCHMVNGSLEDYSLLKRTINDFKIDIIFHLGAQTIVGAAYRDPLQAFESNIRGTYQILEACRKFKDLIEIIVVASSDKAYGISNNLPYTEEMPLKGIHPYDVSKSCTDLIAQSYYYSYHLPVVISRCGNIFGGGDLNWSRIVPGTVRSILNNEIPIIRSNGKFVRDYIYVKDIVNAYLLLIEKNNIKTIIGEAFNFSNEKPITVIEIVNNICKLMKKESIEPKILNLQLVEIFEQFLSSKKAHDILNWHPKFDLTSGLKETIRWYEKFFGELT